MAGAGPGGFLASLGPGERDALRAVGRERAYRRGERLFHEGERADVVYLLVAGRARVFTATSEGNEVTLSVRGPGDLIGEMGALDPGSTRSASAVALDPLRCRVMRAPELIAVLEAHPQATLAVLRLVISRLREADRRRTEFGTYVTTRRLARLLVDSAGDGGVGALDLSQREMAGLIGASRESVARALAELRDRGLVATERRAVLVRDLDGLSRYAG
jgi:CRP/FNR family transcriptional regulator, cyclic AMP receptor protein